MSKQLEQSIGWRITKVVFIVIAIAGAGFLAHFIPEALNNCDWQHRQYISRDDVQRGFFDAPASSLTDCQNQDVYTKFLIVFVVYLVVSVILYFIVRRLTQYIVFGKQANKE